MIHTTSITVRSYEIDVNNHVNNAVYLNYLEHARMQFLVDEGFDYAAFRKAGYGLIVARISIDYKRPALMNDRLTVRTTPFKKKRAFGVFRQEILRGEELIADAEVTWAVVNSEGRLCPMPAEFDKPALSPD